MSSQRWYVNQSCDTSEFATYWNGLGGQAYWPRETGVEAAVALKPKSISGAHTQHQGTVGEI